MSTSLTKSALDVPWGRNLNLYRPYPKGPTAPASTACTNRICGPTEFVGDFKNCVDCTPGDGDFLGPGDGRRKDAFTTTSQRGNINRCKPQGAALFKSMLEWMRRSTCEHGVLRSRATKGKGWLDGVLVAIEQWMLALHFGATKIIFMAQVGSSLFKSTFSS